MTSLLYETGPDLSHYQGGQVDFPAIRRAGHAFVILKATEGDYNTDPLFASNRAKAHAAGLYAGLYHFARAGDPVSEANHFADVVGAVTSTEWTVTDEEVYSADPPAWVGAFDDRVLARLGSMPVSYLNQSARDCWSWRPVITRGSKLWLAKYDGVYTDKPGGPGAWPAVAMEQYTDTGVCPGVPGVCDMNVFYGAACDLPALSRPANPAPAPIPAPIQEDTVRLYHNVATGEVAQCAPGFWQHVPNPSYLKLLQARGLPSEPPLDVSDAEFAFFKAFYGPAAAAVPPPVTPPAS